MRIFERNFLVVLSGAVVGVAAACSSSSDPIASDEAGVADVVATDSSDASDGSFVDETLPDASDANDANDANDASDASDATEIAVEADVAIEVAPETPPPPVYGLDTMPVNTTCVVPAIDPTSGEGMASQLSATGCVDPSDPTKPASGLVPYGVNSPLWSDGALKQRYFALPTGGQITIGDDNDWDFPNGTVLMKTFALASAASPSTPVLVETRLFVRASDGLWRGYSYQWNDAQTDATLLPNATVEVTKTIGTQLWKYPTRAECVFCHNTAPNWSLGLETAQLNRDFAYPSGITSNQIETLAHIGAFVAAPTDPVTTLPKLAAIDDTTASIEKRARAYLHSNCSHCHRPAGPTPPSMDLRYAATLGATKACGSSPSKDFGVPGIKLLKPNDPTLSLIYRRLTDMSRMPPIAVSIEDTAATPVIESWITSLTSCDDPVTGDLHDDSGVGSDAVSGDASPD